MSFSRRSFALFLAMTPGIGGKTVARVLTRNELLNRSPEQFLGLSPETWKEEYRIASKAIASLLERRMTAHEVPELERRLSVLGVVWVTAADAHYPRLIEGMDPDPPGVLFLYGNTKLLNAKTFAVLSSRNARPAELEQIEKLTEAGVLGGEVLVVGHDRPEYQRAAVVPLRWGSPRILCLDRGLFTVLGPDLRNEAFRAARLWRYEFDPATDLVVSPFRPEADFIGINNRVRDRLIGCLARRLDFVTVSPGGNMEQIARRALKAGRTVRVSDNIPEWRQYTQLGASVLE